MVGIYGVYIYTVYCVHMNYDICIQWGNTMYQYVSYIYIYRETKNLPYSTSAWNCLNQPNSIESSHLFKANSDINNSTGVAWHLQDFNMICETEVS